MKKIRVFLGGYVNFLNAQNINCRALSKYLDKNKFKVSTLLFPTKVCNALDFTREDGVTYFKTRLPFRIWRYWAFFRGISTSDVAYLPKGELDLYCRVLAKLFRTKVFTTLEGVMDDFALSRQAHPKWYVEHYKKYEPNLYSITSFLAERELNAHGMHCSSNILYLGVEAEKFCKPRDNHNILNHIIFIGNDLIRKNAMDYLEMASKFPEINFHVVGGNLLENCTIEEFVQQSKIKNVIYHGHMDHSQLSALLSSMDLMYFPSRSEGFPKVHLETACAGVPTLCYSDYGADEWITSGKDGFVVNTKEEAFTIISELKDHPEKLVELSKNAVELGKSFDWRVLVKEWERVIVKIYNE